MPTKKTMPQEKLQELNLIQRLKHERTYRRTIKYCSESIDTWRSIHSKLTKNKKVYTDLIKLIDINLFCLVCHRDLEILVHEIIIKRNVERNLYCRYLALHMYEFFDDVLTIFGKDFRNILLGLNNSQYLQQYKTIQKHLSSLNNTHAEELKTIRNIAIGHRDHHSLTQLKVIDTINPTEIVTIALGVYQWFSPALAFLTEIIAHQHSIQVEFSTDQWTELLKK